MSRAKIGGVVAVVIATLTIAAYFVGTSELEARIERDVEARVGRAQQLLTQNALLEGLGLMKRAETLARDPRVLQALAAKDEIARAARADEAFRKFVSELKKDEPRSDFLAVVDGQGRLSAMLDVQRPEDEDWRVRPAVDAALVRQQVSKDIWDYRNGVMKVGVAPIYEPTSGLVRGAVVVAFALNAREAQAQAALLGMDVAYFFGERVRASSFRTSSGDEDAKRQQAVAGPLVDKGIARAALEKGGSGLSRFDLAGEEYIGSAAPLPLNFSDRTSGALVMMSLSHALEPAMVVRLTILLLGLAAVMMSIFAVLMTARVVLGPLEELEQGVGEIINGNLDYTFKPAGQDFDGLANGLNVMLARIFGRPEPGEETFDQEGNVGEHRGSNVQGTALVSEALGGDGTSDAETLALAKEPEAEYGRRLFEEYVSARKGAGEPVDGVTFEAFLAKLRLSEANLKKKYDCRAVRFRVQTQGRQVTLKPVPIV